MKRAIVVEIVVAIGSGGGGGAGIGGRELDGVVGDTVANWRLQNCPSPAADRCYLEITSI